jgi:hypothetical protein
MPKTLNRRMTPAEFQACVPLVQHLAADRVAAARAVLVDDESQTAVAARYGWTRQAVNICVDKLWETLQVYQTAKRCEAEVTEAALPPGWRVTTVAAPGDMLDRLRADVDVVAAAVGIEPGTIRF